MTQSATRIVDQPQPGFFKLRMVRGGPFVSALIYLPCMIDPDFGFPLDRARRLMALIDGKPADPFHVWNYGRMIDEAEYLYLSDLASWTRKYARSAPEARPTEKVNVREVRFF